MEINRSLGVGFHAVMISFHIDAGTPVLLPTMLFAQREEYNQIPSHSLVHMPKKKKKIPIPKVKERSFSAGPWRNGFDNQVLVLRLP